MLEQDNLADFYLGRGPDAKYLGTISHGAPGQLKVWTRFTAPDPEEKLFQSSDFCTAVVDLMTHCTEATPEEGPGFRYAWTTWPHERDDSSDTAWTYSFDNGAVYVDRRGYLQAVIYSNQARKPSVYPVPR